MKMLFFIVDVCQTLELSVEKWDFLGFTCAPEALLFNLIEMPMK